MKILVFGDTHLGKKLNPSKLEALKNIIEAHDKVIINGDFWDAWKCSFEEFINSDWRELFPLLKEKKSVYIYGNHDPKFLTDTNVKLFSSEQCRKYSFSFGENKYIVIHGDQFDSNCQRMQKFFNTHTKLDRIIEFPITAVGALHMRVLKYKVDFAFLGKIINKKVKNSLEYKDTTYILGHTHHPEISKNKKFVNQGFIEYGQINYVTIDEEGPKLIQETY